MCRQGFSIFEAESPRYIHRSFFTSNNNKKTGRISRFEATAGLELIKIAIPVELICKYYPPIAFWAKREPERRLSELQRYQETLLCYFANPHLLFIPRTRPSLLIINSRISTSVSYISKRSTALVRARVLGLLIFRGSGNVCLKKNNIQRPFVCISHDAFPNMITRK